MKLFKFWRKLWRKKKKKAPEESEFDPHRAVNQGSVVLPDPGKSQARKPFEIKDKEE